MNCKHTCIIIISIYIALFPSFSLFLPLPPSFLSTYLPSLPYPPPSLPPLSSVIGLYVSVVLVIGRFIRGYVSSLPQNLLIDQIAVPDPLLKLCDDIFFVREMKNLILEEILVGKLYYIFRSPERLISLTEENSKEKTD